MDLSPLHGTHAEDPEGFFGHPGVIVVAAVLHSLGALAWIVATAAWIAWRRTLWEGHHASGTKRFADRTVAAAIAANFAGGALRLFQPGHPRIGSLASEPWVQLIFSKHVLLVAAVGVTVWMHAALGPRLLAAFRAGQPDPRLERLARIVPYLVLAAVGAAAVLGSASTVAL
ncbi:MAG TPA: hypothetical protein VFH47_00810 [Candidatus Thermoplasmatota archaeon]|nr:hypothetical protein [Candidatus Thermoplasmatota archaeon]